MAGGPCSGWSDVILVGTALLGLGGAPVPRGEPLPSFQQKERHSSGGWNPFIKRWTPAFAGVTLFWLGDPVLAGVTLFWLGRHYWGWVERLRQGANPYRHSSKRNVIPAEAGIHLQKDGPQPSLG